MRVTARRYVVVNPALAGRPVVAGGSLAGGGEGAPRKAGKLARKALGLGDWVESWAKGVAGWVDAETASWGPRFATKLVGCSACSKRRRFLNQVVPDVRRWASWRGALGRVVAAWRCVYGRRKAGAAGRTGARRAA